jgi:hypothetical protein
MCFPHESDESPEIYVENTFICVKPPSSSKKRSSSAPARIKVERYKVSPPGRISPSILSHMKRAMEAKGHVTMQWFRVVHSGYGKPLWFQAVEATKRPLVGSRSKADGCFVAVLPGETFDDVVTEMINLNLQVRRLSRFRAMKRANKSRVQFKSDPIWTTVRESGGVVVTSLPPFL